MYDLIVVGAGPAGSSAARVAAKAGLDVLILEKETFPRYKPCGGALSERAKSLLDFPLPESLCERTITGARVHYGDIILERHKGYRLSTLVTRSRFDQFLLHKAQEVGAELVVQKVQDYKENENHIEVLTKLEEYKSRFLVISSGYQDSLKKNIQSRDTRDRYCVSMVTEIQEDDKKIEEKLHNTLDFYFDVAENGYGWIFPHKGYYSVGIWGQASRLKDPRQTMISFLRKNGFQGDYRLHGHKDPLGGNTRKIAGRRVLLTGDSAGFVDAFTGEGIYYALRSGQIAAQVISENDSNDVSRSYEALCKKEICGELDYSLWLSKFLNGHPEILPRILIRHEEVLDRYLEIAAAKGSYKDFVSWVAPRLIQNYIDDYNNKINKVPEILKTLLANERINIKIILNDGGILRVGYTTKNSHITQVVENGLIDPTIMVTATEDAISRIGGSKDPIATFWKERKHRRVDIRGRYLTTKAKLEAALASAGALSFVHNILNRLESSRVHIQIQQETGLISPKEN